MWFSKWGLQEPRTLETQNLRATHHPMSKWTHPLGVTIFSAASPCQDWTEQAGWRWYLWRSPFNAAVRIFHRLGEFNFTHPPAERLREGAKVIQMDRARWQHDTKSGSPSQLPGPQDPNPILVPGIRAGQGRQGSRGQWWAGAEAPGCWLSIFTGRRPSVKFSLACSFRAGNPTGSWRGGESPKVGPLQTRRQARPVQGLQPQQGAAPPPAPSSRPFTPPPGL